MFEAVDQAVHLHLEPMKLCPAGFQILNHGTYLTAFSKVSNILLVVDMICEADE